MVRQLRAVKIGDAGRVEQQIINAYKRRGQCWLNKSKVEMTFKMPGKKLCIPSLKLKFRSQSEAARHIGVCVGTLKSYIKSGDLKVRYIGCK